jgi:polyketide cyclase/dehydrase/lipid transport protein
MADSTFEVKRSIVIDAPAPSIQLLIEDFQQWPKWSPWEDIDPQMKRDYTGPTYGVGSVYAWSGNRKAGKGRMEITGAEPGRVALDLDFSAPMKTQNQLAFDLSPQAEATEVTWTMTGTQKGLARLFGKIYPMEKLVGKDFEKGLARLKAAAETPPGV